MNLRGLSHTEIEGYAHCKVIRGETGGDVGFEQANRRDGQVWQTAGGLPLEAGSCQRPCRANRLL